MPLMPRTPLEVTIERILVAKYGKDKLNAAMEKDAVTPRPAQLLMWWGFSYIGFQPKKGEIPSPEVQHSVNIVSFGGLAVPAAEASDQIVTAFIMRGIYIYAMRLLGYPIDDIGGDSQKYLQFAEECAREAEKRKGLESNEASLESMAKVIVESLDVFESVMRKYGPGATARMIAAHLHDTGASLKEAN